MASVTTPAPSAIGRVPALNLPLDIVTFIIVKAREYDVKESDSDPDEGSNAIDDGQTDVLTEKSDDPVREELLGAIRGLNDDERMRLLPDEVVETRQVRFRTLGCWPLTGAIESQATSVAGIIAELLESRSSERQGRLVDSAVQASMERKKREGYF